MRPAAVRPTWDSTTWRPDRPAAYIVTRWLQRPGTVLVTMRRSAFLAEPERVESFVAEVGRLDARLRTRVITETDGLDASLAALVGEALAPRPFGTTCLGPCSRSCALIGCCQGRPRPWPPTSKS
jgi:hypothetical protein